MLRAWSIAHHGLAHLASVVVLTTLLVLFARSQVPGVTGGPPIPVWALCPPAYAVLASVATVSRMPDAAADPRTLRPARAGWLVTVLVVSAVGAGGVSHATGLGGLVPATGVLVALTFGASTLLGLGSLLVGAVPAVVVVTLTRSIDPDRAALWDPSRAPALWALLTIAGLAGALAYAAWGARRSDRSIDPDTT